MKNKKNWKNGYFYRAANPLCFYSQNLGIKKWLGFGNTIEDSEWVNYLFEMILTICCFPAESSHKEFSRKKKPKHKIRTLKMRSVKIGLYCTLNIFQICAK